MRPKSIDILKTAEKLFEECCELLESKKKAYAVKSPDGNKFFRMASVEDRTPAEECYSLALKPILVLGDMVKHPDDFTKEEFEERLKDSINYLFWLSALWRKN